LVLAPYWTQKVLGFPDVAPGHFALSVGSDDSANCLLDITVEIRNISAVAILVMGTIKVTEVDACDFLDEFRVMSKHLKETSDVWLTKHWLSNHSLLHNTAESLIYKRKVEDRLIRAELGGYQVNQLGW